MMDTKQRMDFVSNLYKVQGDLFAMMEICRVSHSLLYGTNTKKALDAVNEMIDDCKPDISGEGVVPSHSTRLNINGHNYRI